MSKYPRGKPRGIFSMRCGEPFVPMNSALTGRVLRVRILRGFILLRGLPVSQTARLNKCCGLKSVWNFAGLLRESSETNLV
jgi:hypothetical protein